MKFIANMGISPDTVTFLQKLGYAAIHLDKAGLGRLPDSQILAKAYAEGYVVLTHDLDFGDLMAASGAIAPSVVIFRLRNMRPESVNRFLQVIERFQVEHERGAVITVTEGNIRVRELPIGKEGLVNAETLQ